MGLQLKRRNLPIISATRRLLPAVLLAFAGCARAADSSRPELLVFAASSLTDVLQELGAAYTRATDQAVKFSFASSAVAARQIEAGARADAFFSADVEWMNYLEERNLIERSSRQNVVENRLALVAPAGSQVELKIGADFPIAAVLGSGRLATGDPDYVPVGRYAKSALTTLGVWNEVSDRLVRADNVRAALMFVARGEAALGIVYETDAKAEPKVRIVDLFPENSHPPIRYPVAVIRGSRAGAQDFVAFLKSPAAQDIFVRYGFRPLPMA